MRVFNRTIPYLLRMQGPYISFTHPLLASIAHWLRGQNAREMMQMSAADSLYNSLLLRIRCSCMKSCSYRKATDPLDYIYLRQRNSYLRQRPDAKLFLYFFLFACLFPLFFPCALDTPVVCKAPDKTAGLPISKKFYGIWTNSSALHTVTGVLTQDLIITLLIFRVGESGEE